MRKKTFKTIERYLFMAFLFSSTTFSVVYAQEKEVIKNFEIKNTKFEYNINKLTTDEVLNAIKKEVNEQNIALLEFSKIKRNNSGEIISITTAFKDGKGNKQQKAEYNSQGISPFSVVVNEQENGNRFLEITTEQNFFFIKNGQAYLQEEDMTTNNFLSPSVYEPLLDAETIKMMERIEDDIRKQQETLLQVMQNYSETIK